MFHLNSALVPGGGSVDRTASGPEPVDDDDDDDVNTEDSSVNLFLNKRAPASVHV